MTSEHDLEARLKALEERLNQQIRVQTEQLQAHEKLLQEWNESPLNVTSTEWGEFLSRIDQVLDKAEEKSSLATCPLAQVGNNRLEIMLRGSKTRTETERELVTVLDGAVSLTIVDPYFLASGLTDDAFRNSLDKIIPSTVSSIELFIGTEKKIEKMEEIKKYRRNANAFKAFLKSRSISENVYKTGDIHDRVWIRASQNGCKGYVIGTSFNGFGKQCAFLLPLPCQDLLDFECELNKIRNNGNARIQL